MIDTVKDRHSLYSRLLPKPGEQIDRSTERYVYQYQPPAEEMRCPIYHKVLWPQFRFISSRCRQCYKVVVKPNNVVELFDLYEIQKQLGYHSKCGSEITRDNTCGIYAGYFYCYGIKEGQKRYKEVREKVPEHINVILKRYCTEFEIGTGLGPSNQLPEMTEEEMQFEDYFLKHYIEQEISIDNMPIHAIKGAMIRWIHDARNIGDLTYKQFTNGYDLYNQVITYH